MRTPLIDIYGRFNLTIYTKPAYCGGKCIYCFSEDPAPQSFIKNQDTIRAAKCDWDPAKQLKKLFELYGLKKDANNKIEIIILGGSFTAYPSTYLMDFVKRIYDYLNNVESRCFEEAKSAQVNARDRCVALCIETRPDLINESICGFLLQLGVTKVALGVQSLENHVLDVNQRLMNDDDIATATRLLRTFGFKVGYHMMVGMPGSDFNGDVYCLTEKIWEPEFCPDYLKIYPCVLLKKKYGQAKLRNLVDSEWSPITDVKYNELLCQVKPNIPSFVYVGRIQRILPVHVIDRGPAVLIDRNRYSGICKCIWHRMIGRHSVVVPPLEYVIGILRQGHGYYFEASSEDGLVLGCTRVTILPDNTALVRELRVFGKMIPFGMEEQPEKGVQHCGVGKALMKAVELHAINEGCLQVLVNSAVGSIEYFQKLGYSNLFPFMKKNLNEEGSPLVGDRQERGNLMIGRN